MTFKMVHRSEVATPDNSDDESGDAFTDGDFEDSEDETLVENAEVSKTNITLTETVNEEITKTVNGESLNGSLDENSEKESPKVNGRRDSEKFVDAENQSLLITDARRDSHNEQSPSIVGILGDQQNHVCNRGTGK